MPHLMGCSYQGDYVVNYGQRQINNIFLKVTLSLNLLILIYVLLHYTLAVISITSERDDWLEYMSGNHKTVNCFYLTIIMY